MESSIKAFSKTLASMCDHIQISCDSLLDSVRRTPLPRESATETFLRCLDRRSSSAGADLEVLESMAFGTVSFEELLGHCNEVYKTNQSDLAEVEQRLEELGFEILMDGGDEVLDVEDEVDFALTYHGSASPASVIKKRIEEDPLFAESISLKDLGLSDACLATLASEDSDELLGDDLLVSESLCDSLVDISRDDYDGLPSNLKCLASWEDLQATVTKLNSKLREQHITFRSKGFSRDEFETFGLGIKGKTCLLLLLRMNRLVMETIGGSIIYRISHCT